MPSLASRAYWRFLSARGHANSAFAWRLGHSRKISSESVVAEGVVMAAIGVVAGAAFGLVVARVAGSYFGDLKMPGALPVIVSAFVLLGAAVVASMLPAARAARVDVMQALRSE